MLCNYNDAQDALNSTSFLHPNDPIVDQEYENLIKAWKHQLIDKIPTTPNNDYVRFAWMRLMDHYLDQQWLDSKQMMQCAQAWSARESISLPEAVHTMNILGLKSMQRSLDARQELLQALGDPEFMVSFGISPIQSNDDKRVSLSGSEDDESEVHAPLLMKHNTVNEEDEAIITTDEIIDDYHAEDHFERSRITSSSSTPNISSLSSEDEQCRYYKASSWKEIDSSDNVQWKSWFLNSHNNEGEKIKPIVFADEKVQTDDIQPYLMVRSESSISAFRPISNNLAPRCQQPQQHTSLERKTTITKSKSFPSKSPASVPQKERNFMIRSFVNKKVSLSKFFNGRKTSTSSCSSSSSRTK